MEISRRRPVGPGGDISYPDAAPAVQANDPYLVLGAEKYDTGLAFSGWLDELRISTKLRYAANFPRPRAPFVSDRFTAALYHFDDGDGATLHDSSGAVGGPSSGQIKRGGTANGPAWMPDSPFNVGGLVNNATIAFTPFVSGFSSPVEMVHAGDNSGRLYVVQQGGLIRIIRNGAILAPPFLNLTSKVIVSSEQGLLGLAFHPNYAVNGFFYVYYTRAGDGMLMIERYQRDPNNTNLADPNSAKTMLTIPHIGQSNHNGGKLAFGHDGYLYAGTGDGGSGNDPPNNAQNLSVRLGKLLRLDVDQNVNVPPYYGVPATNPFPYPQNQCDGVSIGICPEIWAYGLRNPWRWTFDKLTGDLFIGDVGQSAREEVDFDAWPGTAGRNYGWRVMEGNLCTPGVSPSNCTPPPNYVAPIFDYPHPPGVAVIGGYRYRGDAVPALAGAYVYADEGAGLMWAATRADTGVVDGSAAADGNADRDQRIRRGRSGRAVCGRTRQRHDLQDHRHRQRRGRPAELVGNGLFRQYDRRGARSGCRWRWRDEPAGIPGGNGPAVGGEQARSCRSPRRRSASGGRRPRAFFVDVDFDFTVDQKVYFGATTDKPLVGRIDPGRTYDLVVYRNGLWYADRDRNGDRRLHGLCSAASRTMCRSSRTSTATGATIS